MNDGLIALYNLVMKVKETEEKTKSPLKIVNVAVFLLLFVFIMILFLNTSFFGQLILSFQNVFSGKNTMLSVGIMIGFILVGFFIVLGHDILVDNPEYYKTVIKGGTIPCIILAFTLLFKLVVVLMNAVSGFAISIISWLMNIFVFVLPFKKKTGIFSTMNKIFLDIYDSIGSMSNIENPKTFSK